MVSLEKNPELSEHAKKNISSFNASLLDLIDLVAIDTLEYIKAYEGDPFDFVFFDADLNQRASEFQLLLDGGHLSRGAVCIFHDTSSLRDNNAALNKAIKDFCEDSGCERLICPLSRGLTVLRIPEQ